MSTDAFVKFSALPDLLVGWDKHAQHVSPRVSVALSSGALLYEAADLVLPGLRGESQMPSKGRLDAPTACTAIL